LPVAAPDGAMKIHTTIETNGYYGDKLSDAELDTIDLVLLGIKTWDPARHKALNGSGSVSPTRCTTPSPRPRSRRSAPARCSAKSA
jgi:pyruvate-formate lyase-activating enzyme